LGLVAEVEFKRRKRLALFADRLQVVVADAQRLNVSIEKVRCVRGGTWTICNRVCGWAWVGPKLRIGLSC